MPTLILDIETIPDLSVWTPQLNATDPVPPPHACQIACIGALLVDDKGHPQRCKVMDGETEADMLDTFAKATNGRPTLVTWSGRRFDLTVIVARSLRWGVPQPTLFDKDVRYRYSDSGHVDVMDHLSDFGAARSLSLDGVARLIGLPGKAGTDGGDVAAMVARGEIEAVRRYCLRDVVQTAFAYYRYRLVQGAKGWGLTEYQRRAADLLAFVEGQMPDLVAATDTARLLLQTGGPVDTLPATAA